MDVVASVEAPVSAEKLFDFVADLGNYPQWLELVHEASSSNGDADQNPVWLVELRARLGIFARSKRLRMSRTVFDRPRVVVFERDEKDGRRHSAWVLKAVVTSTPNGSMLEANLHYSGSLFTGGVLERALAEQIAAAREKLISSLSAN
ncbi:MAG: SRPBCC family protein [Actinobacteria bacterium]|nr:SRPBCC family protein [Actinomycetota bacterium]